MCILLKKKKSNLKRLHTVIPIMTFWERQNMDNKNLLIARDWGRVQAEAVDSMWNKNDTIGTYPSLYTDPQNVYQQ